MSSTNRGGQRTEADNYPTPAWCVHRLLEDPYAREFLPGGRWLEPGAGDGAVICAVNQVRSDVTWTALEVREECRAPLVSAVGPDGFVVIENYISPPEPSALGGGYAVAIGNPPYRLAEEFIRRSLEIAHTVALLLRVNYLASERRNSFMRSSTPDTFILPNRPSFRGQGTDSPEYAWLIWPRERQRACARLRILATTPLEVRAAAKLSVPHLLGKRELRRQKGRTDQDLDA